MDTDKIEKIKVMVADVFEKRQKFYALGMMNRPTDSEKAKAALIDYELARAEMFEAEAALRVLQTGLVEPTLSVLTTHR